jgi:hypothetical protein
MLLKDGRRRPLARAALADRLPPEVLNNNVRGAQMPDWYEHITAERTSASFDEVVHSEAARSLVDFPKIRGMIAAWPQEGWNERSTILEYRVDLMHALSAAHFVAAAERDRPTYPSLDKVAESSEHGEVYQQRDNRDPASPSR